MKKIFCLLMCLIMVCGIFTGCNSQGSGSESTAGEAAHKLLVGYSRADITPQKSVPLGGLSNSVVGGSTSDRFLTDVKNPLYATCIAISDETGNTILLYHLDLLLSYATKLMSAKMSIARALNINGNQIMITSTHNHSGPDLYSSEPVMAEYIDYLGDQMLEAAKAAMADRKAAKMHTASGNIVNMNFVRHYLLSDGSYAGDNFGKWAGKTIVGHAVDVDNEMQLVKFTREGGKDVLLMNWQAHPTGHSGDNRYSVLSHVDEVRKEVEASLNCHFAYFLGASGNINSTSRIPEENQVSGYEAHGKKLGEYAVQLAKSFQEATTDSIRFLGSSYTGEDVADPSVTRKVDMFAFSFGDVAFVTAPYEMFCENGMAIKNGSPYPMTFVATCSNENTSYLAYIPSSPTFAYTSYEVKMNKFVPGVAEILATEYVNMLKQLKTQE